MNTLCALAAESPREGRARGLAEQILEAMRAIAERQGLTAHGRSGAPLVQGAVPDDGHRALYPVAPRRRTAVRPLDARPRTPWRASGHPASQVLCRSPVRSPNGKAWTEMAFPESGDYVFPEGLAPVHIDRSADRGAYWEPNVWMVHPDITS